MQTNEQLLSAIENYLAQTEFPAEPELLYAPIGYSLAGGGKRLRPMLLLLSCGLFADDVDVALPAAARERIADRIVEPFGFGRQLTLSEIIFEKVEKLFVGLHFSYV